MARIHTKTTHPQAHKTVQHSYVPWMHRVAWIPDAAQHKQAQWLPGPQRRGLWRIRT